MPHRIRGVNENDFDVIGLMELINKVLHIRLQGDQKMHATSARAGVREPLRVYVSL